MKLFTVGPVEMSEETRQCGAEKIPYFRTAEFSGMMLDIEKMFLRLTKAPAESKLVTLTASGTGAMEAAVCNLLSPNDKVLVINGGSFGHRFVRLCQCFDVPYEELYLEYGDVLSEDKLAPFENQGYTALLVNLNETSVGQLYDGKMLGDFCRRNHMLYIADAISTLFADTFSMEEYGANAVICSSQKALALPPGLSFIVLDQIAQARIWAAKVHSMYFDLKDCLKNMERGQTPFTPAVGILVQLYHRLTDITEKGIENIVSEHAQRAAYFRDLCRKNNIAVAAFPKSNALTPIEFPKGNAYDIFLKLKDQYGIMLTPSGGDLKDKILRVGHLGNLIENDYDEVVRLLKEAM